MKANTKLTMDLQPYTIYLHTSPHIQTAAIAHLAVFAECFGDVDTDPDAERAGKVFEACMSAMGIAEDSPLALDVQDVVMELSYKMHDALIKAGLLRPDCANAWQEERVKGKDKALVPALRVA
jgi:hypothetical protein